MHTLRENDIIYIYHSLSSVLYYFDYVRLLNVLKIVMHKK